MLTEKNSTAVLDRTPTMPETSTGSLTPLGEKVASELSNEPTPQTHAKRMSDSELDAKIRAHLGREPLRNTPQPSISPAHNDGLKSPVSQTPLSEIFKPDELQILQQTQQPEPDQPLTPAERAAFDQITEQLQQPIPPGFATEQQSHHAIKTPRGSTVAIHKVSWVKEVLDNLGLGKKRPKYQRRHHLQPQTNKRG